jgi:two-component system, chemotaxis family, CheB/CheR fusion protein
MADPYSDGAVKGAELLAEAVMDTIHESLIILDGQLRVRMANRSFYRTFCVDVESTTDKLIFELGNGQWNIPELRNLLEQILPQHNFFEEFEVVHDFPEIGKKTMLLNARKLQRLEWQEELILVAINDISEQKKYDDAIKRSNSELATFAHTVAHDLQSPLRSIRIFTHMLFKKFRTDLDEEAEKLVGFIEKGTASMEDLIRSLLTFSLATEPEPGGKQWMSLQAAFETAVGNLAETIELGAAIVTSEPLPETNAYPTQIVQIMQNLISNGIKYHKPDIAPVISVAVAEKNGLLVISVTDNGIGINKKDYVRIWDPLKRLHGAEVPGAGIGLATCRKLVEHHGGTIWLQSEVGVGSTFYFSICK